MKKGEKKRKQEGLPPGSVVFTGNQKVDKVHVHYLRYTAKHIKEATLHNHANIVLPQSPDNEVDWYDIRGIHDTELIEHLGTAFSIHPLILEDIADIHQRPKYEEYKKGHFITFKAFAFDKNTQKIEAEQVAIYYRKGLLISFQENESDLFETVRHRIRTAIGKVRSKNSDYLCFALMDMVVDSYFSILDSIGDVIEELEDNILEDPEEGIRNNIHRLRKEILPIRKAVMPLREALSLLSRSDTAFYDDTTLIFIRDLYDHTIQVMDMIETARDMLSGLQDLHISEISFKMNQVMQVLTIITTLFVPISFLAGLYGMNFQYIPELQYRNGYFILIAVMILIVGLSLFYFRRKKWL